MALKQFNPTSPGSRFKTVQTFDEITTQEPHKPLVEPLKSTGGRNNKGELTSWWRGGGHKRMYRIIECFATIGQVGNIEHENVSIGKAGRSRWMGKRPHVRGVAMNPVDHPLGGGEGKTSGGRHPVSPWGLPTKGYKTRNRKSTDKFIVQRRQK